MAPSHVPAYVVPNPRIPSALGVLNILIGSLLVLTSLSLIAWEVFSPAFLKWVEAQNRSALEQSRADRRAKIAELKRREAAAPSEAQKATLKAERQELEAELDPEPDDLGIFGKKSPGEEVAFWVNETTALVLNVALVVAGAGLLGLRPWARRLALWVAGLKLARLVTITAVALLVLIPMQVQQSLRRGARMASPWAAADVAQEMARMTAVSASLSSAALLFFGAIYPALLLWLLSKRSVKAACDGPPGPKPAEGDGLA